jgi:hypothetical protein
LTRPPMAGFEVTTEVEAGLFTFSWKLLRGKIS